MRLDRFLTEMDRGTRSEVKKLIAKGRVSVDGSVVKDPGAGIEPGIQEVLLDGEPVRYAAYEYYMLNKPRGVVSASRLPGGPDRGKLPGGRSRGGRSAETSQEGTEDRARVCVTDLIGEKLRKDLFPAGRLDIDTEGLMLITNDGALAHRLLSPKHHVNKTYYVELDGSLEEEMLRRLTRGVDIGDERPTLPCEIRKLTNDSCEITIREGRYHQIKRMFATEGLTVTALKRLSMGPLLLDPGLGPGEYRALTPEELGALQELS